MAAGRGFTTCAVLPRHTPELRKAHHDVDVSNGKLGAKCKLSPTRVKGKTFYNFDLIRLVTNQPLVTKRKWEERARVV